MKPRIPNLPPGDFEQVLTQAPLMVVDAVVFRGEEVLLVKRASEPFNGYWHLPGGFLGYGESPLVALNRILRHETGLFLKQAAIIDLFDLYGKDPRGHLISAAYVVLSHSHEPKARPGEEVGWFGINDPGCQPFLKYHGEIIARALLRRGR